MRAASLAWMVLAAAALALLLSGSGSAAPGLENPALLEDRGPIRIDRDADFTAAKGVRGGNGTAENPYLIAHWRINHTEIHVRIANTTRAWVLRNVELLGQCDTGGSNNVCGLEVGVLVTNSRGGTVIHNRMVGQDRHGIHIDNSLGVEVVENEVLGGAGSTPGTSLLVRGSLGTQVRGNRVVDAGVGTPPSATAGIRVWFSNDTLVAGNEVLGAKEFGVNLLVSRRTEVVDNTIARANVGVEAQAGDGLLRYNTITDSRVFGLRVGSGFVHADHNVIRFNQRGVEVAGNANATLRENDFEGHQEFALRVLANATADARENWWGAADGPDVDGAGPGGGEAIVVAPARPEQVVYLPFLTQRFAESGAFAPRSARNVVAGDPGPGGGGSGGSGGGGDPAPRAVFEGPAEAAVGEAVEFSAARSFDPEGGALRYAWDFGDGGTAAAARAVHVFNATGAFPVRLTVTDPTGLSGQASVEVRVVRPVFAVGLRVNDTVFRNDELLLEAVPAGATGPVAFRFTTAGPGSFAGEGSAARSTRVRFAEPGERVVGVEARMGAEVRTAFARVLVVNRPPVALLAVEPGEGDSLTDFALTGAGSADPDGDALTYAWDLGGGQAASGANVTRRFPAGLNVLQLTVSDGHATATAQHALQVRPAAEAGPGPRPAPGAEPLAALAGLVLAAFAARGGTRR